MSDEPEPSYAHVPDRGRYEVRLGDEVAGFAQYRLPDPTHVDVVHTEIDPTHHGRGLASGLVGFALADVRAAGKRIVPSCPYVAAWIRRHPGEYDDLTDWPHD
ncbi:MAG: GNAT family N-acetyltransferase [Nocardioides sp.]|uniref:GNAT family N-acetyltransferase n=1 Tax=Nocardioides sp. TaxID=35761 RepID=UPI0039E67823